MTMGYYVARIRGILRLLKALNSDYGLQLNESWEVGMMIAKHLHQIADEITKTIEEAKAKDEKDRNGG